MAFSIAVLASGRGSNLQALIDAQANGVLDISISGVYSNKLNAYAIERAKQAQLETHIVEPKYYPNQHAYDLDLFNRIMAHKPQLIVCAGYMRIISAVITRKYAHKIINIHPSLLPAYPGLHTHERALQAGDSQHGATVHFVTEHLDQGPCIAQTHIPVYPSDTAEVLAARLLPKEHQLLITCVKLFTQQRIQYTPAAILYNNQPLVSPLLIGDNGQILTTNSKNTSTQNNA